jgi:mannosyltransferase OCH1-like enzyme
MIPKIIHQVFGLWDPFIPPKIKKRINTWKRLHPSYKHITWNKKTCRNLIKTKFNWFLNMYDSYQYNVQRADAVRYFILYEYGGIYSDVDLEPYKPIEAIRRRCNNKGVVFYKSANSDKLTNDFIMSKQRCPFWKTIFKNLMILHNTELLSKHLTVMYSTGPLFLDKMYNLIQPDKKYVYIIDSKYINNCDVSIMKPARNKEAYLIRHEGSAWHSSDSKLINILYTYSEEITYILIALLSSILLTFLLKKRKLQFNNS